MLCNLNLRHSVLQAFKKLHRTRKRVFDGDVQAQSAARAKINEEFKKNKHVTDEQSISAMLKFAEDVEVELRTQVIQAKEIRPGVFAAKITQDTLKLDNIAFNENAIQEDGIPGGKGTPCCKEQVHS